MQLDIIGKKLGEAASVINEADMSFRVVERDGVHYAVTRDVRPGRVNLHLVDGVVTAYELG